MSDWEEEQDDAIDKETRKQPSFLRNCAAVEREAKVRFGVRSAGRQRADGRGEPGVPGTGARGAAALPRSRVSGDEARGRARPLVFSVERQEAGRIIGRFPWPKLTSVLIVAASFGKRLQLTCVWLFCFHRRINKFSRL